MPKRSTTSTCVRAGLPAATTAIDVRCVGWRPIGASIVVVARDVAVHEREVLALDRARGELAHEIGLRLERLGDDQEAARVLVETMHDARARQRGELRARDAGARSAACRRGCRCRDARRVPRGLSTTSSASSSYTTASAIACADHVHRRPRRRLRSPPAPRRRASLWRGIATTAPSTRTSPASIQPLSRLRECSASSCGERLVEAAAGRAAGTRQAVLAGRSCRLPSVHRAAMTRAGGL